MNTERLLQCNNNGTTLENNKYVFTEANYVQQKWIYNEALP